MTEGIDIDRLSGWIGREEIETDEIGATIAARYHATFGMAGTPPRPGEVVPRLIHWCLAVALTPTAELGPDGHPRRGGFLPPVDLPRRMWAGGEIAFHGDLRVGDTVRRVSQITGIEPKAGRSGPLCFVTVEHRFEVDGAVRLVERQDIVYRGGAAGGAERGLPAAPQGRDCRSVDPTPPLLFRYSALTFNTHRIHYDHPYVTGVEGYPGLVVHGPMQAALLLNFATELHGAPPGHFAFRSLSPLTDSARFNLHADAVDGGLKLWTAAEAGPVAMTAEARWG